MASNIDISSNALVLIGDEPINSFSDAGAGAQVAANLYPDTKKRMLSEHPWSFALKQQKLNRLSQRPDILTGYSYAYQIPPDLIRLWNVQTWSDYIIIGELIYSNQTELLATYVYDVEEVLMPPHFVKALEYSLASDFAIAITEDNNLATLMETKAINAKNQAMGIDSQNRPQQAIQDSPLIGVRYGGGIF